MPGKIDELAEILEEELELVRRLLDLAKDARAAAVAVDPALLTQIVREQEECSAALESAEARRISAAGDVGGELGLTDQAPVKLTAIAERVPAGMAARLRNLGARLRRTAAELRQATAFNRELLEGSLAHVGEFFSVLAEARSAGAGYGKPSGARRPASAAAAIMDRKA